jgi:hypothetical protein
VSSNYEFVLSGEAARFLLGSPARVRVQAEGIFDSLASNPFVEADFAEHGPTGRVYYVKVYGDIIVTYWADHAVREIRILRCEIA